MDPPPSRLTRASRDDLADAAHIRRRIDELVELEHTLWDDPRVDPGERELLAEIRVELDRCWDARRRRRAHPTGPLKPSVPVPPNELEGPEPEPEHEQWGSPHPAYPPGSEPATEPKLPGDGGR